MLDPVPGPTISSFTIQNSKGQISASGIELSLTYKWSAVDLTKLTPIFETTGRKVTVNGIVQISGVTTLDFTNSVEYSVWGYDATVKKYRVTVTGDYSSVIPDTGQDSCASGAGGTGAMSACPNASIGAVQDGDFAYPRSFSGPIQNSNYPNDYVTIDNVTGFIWKTCAEGLTGATCGSGTVSTFSNIYAGSAQCNSLNNQNAGAGYANLKSWHMPTREELLTIINYSGISPAIDALQFPGTTSLQHWTATPNSVSPATQGWYVQFNPLQSYTTSFGSLNHLRCVAGNGVYQQSYADNGDGTITDSGTKLRWQKCTRGLNNDATCSGTAAFTNWTTGLSYCQGLTLANRTWRLPSINELVGLVQTSTSSPAINQVFFPATLSGNYFSSTTASTTTFAMAIDFTGGSLLSDNKGNSRYVRCVSGASSP